MIDNENPQDGQDLLESMRDIYNEDQERPIDQMEVKEAEPEAAEAVEVEEVAEVEEVQPESAEEEQPEAEPVEELPPLEPNALWEPHIKEMFPTLPRDVQEFLLSTTTNWQTGYNQKFQELANERKQLEPIQQTFSDPLLSGYLNQQGWQPHQAVQVLGQHIKNILTNPKAGYQTLMQAFGHNPTEIFSAEDEPWVDPAVQQVNQRLDEFERQKQQEQQRFEAERLQQANQEVQNAMQLKDDQGNLVYPRFMELVPEMMNISNAIPDLNIEQVYRMAEARNPAPQQDPVSTKPVEVPPQVQRSQAAKKTVQSKQSAKPNTKQQPLSLEEELKRSYRQGTGV